mmetsp:Transcript_72378/g.195731  ORF Transcript_72378/g.195731 Transcript_72378/m.195731 type:complete len:318 (+) Transcript_72378:144-1097(+)
MLNSLETSVTNWTLDRLSMPASMNGVSTWRSSSSDAMASSTICMRRSLTTTGSKPFGSGGASTAGTTAVLSPASSGAACGSSGPGACIATVCSACSRRASSLCTWSKKALADFSAAAAQHALARTSASSAAFMACLRSPRPSNANACNVNASDAAAERPMQLNSRSACLAIRSASESPPLQYSICALQNAACALRPVPCPPAQCSQARAKASVAALRALEHAAAKPGEGAAASGEASLSIRITCMAVSSSIKPTSRCLSPTSRHRPSACCAMPSASSRLPPAMCTEASECSAYAISLLFPASSQSSSLLCAACEARS